MFNTFESTESRRHKFKKRRQKKHREKKLKELNTIGITIKSLVATDTYTIKVDSSRLLKELYTIIMEDDETKRRIHKIVYKNKLLFVYTEFQQKCLSVTQKIDEITIAEFFDITKEQLKNKDKTWTLLITYPPQSKN